MSTAPTNLFKVPHHRGLAEGLKELANLHIVTQLERGAAYWMASATLADWDNEPGAEEASAELWNVMVNLACCIVAEADAWKKLCGAFFSFPLEEMNLGAG
ncbi:MAG TPA: hypothetical protein VGY77_08075 [Gemmataceae bacterium]|nr:hypothetical protein [Gemmataceae bacterium]